MKQEEVGNGRVVGDWREGSRVGTRNAQGELFALRLGIEVADG